MFIRVKPEKDLKITESIRIRVRDMHYVEDEVYSRWMAVLTLDQSQVVETVASTDKYEVQLERTRPNCRQGHTALNQELSSARVVFIFGKHISLLSMKVSTTLEKTSKRRKAGARPMGVVVSVLTDESSFLTHEILTENLFHTSNIIPCQAKVYELSYQYDIYLLLTVTIYNRVHLSICV